MANLNIRDLPIGLRSAFKAYCAAKNTTMRQEIIRHMQKVTGYEEARKKKQQGYAAEQLGKMIAQTVMEEESKK